MGKKQSAETRAKALVCFLFLFSSLSLRLLLVIIGIMCIFWSLSSYFNRVQYFAFYHFLCPFASFPPFFSAYIHLRIRLSMLCSHLCCPCYRRCTPNFPRPCGLSLTLHYSTSALVVCNFLRWFCVKTISFNSFAAFALQTVCLVRCAAVAPPWRYTQVHLKLARSLIDHRIKSISHYIIAFTQTA